jgi:chromosome segregation ATPase
VSGNTATGGLSMYGENLRKAVGLGILAVLIWVPARAQQQSSQQSGSGDPVADAARKAREEKKDAPKPKKVYTDDDISTKKSDISVVGNPPPQNDAATSTSSTAIVNPSAKGGMTVEQQWRKRFADQRARIARAEQELDVLQREENKAGLQYYSDPTKAMKEQLTRNEINQKAAKIEAKKQEIAALKQQMEDLEDELRKAGGDPGWAR